MKKKANKASVLFIFLRAVISLSIIGVAVGICVWLYMNPAHTQKGQGHEKKKIYVTTDPISFGDFPVEINVMGKVSAAREMVLKAQVSGKIIAVSDKFVPGGFLTEGEEILRICPDDYELKVKSKRAAYKQALASYELEQGRQEIAKNEIEILQRNSKGTLKIENTDLALRKPQLAQAKATLDAAKAALDMAIIDLERTSLQAPFNAIVTSRNTNIGNVIAAQGALAELVAIDEYWINIDLALSDLGWLDIPGSKADIMSADMKFSRRGKLYKQSGTVDEQSRLTGIIVRVDDPLLLSKDKDTQSISFPLILGDYLPVKLIGKTLSGAARIPQEYLRKNQAGEDVIWLEQGARLVIQPVTIAYRDRKFAYITKGLEYASNIVTSDIITPVAGMDIVVDNNGEGH